MPVTVPMLGGRTRQTQSGFILIDKPAGITSHDVVDRMRRLTGVRCIGHAGTLDPFATGLLIVAVGREATKQLATFVGMDKSYDATLILGATSDTYDRDGVVTRTDARPPAHRDIDIALSPFLGSFDQRAPVFSAKKIHGRKLYELARAGKATDSMRPTKRVTITRLDIVEFAWPRLRLAINCSSGTYIRSLADDIGRALGCGAYCDELQRTRIGQYRIENAVTLDDLDNNLPS